MAVDLQMINVWPMIQQWFFAGYGLKKLMCCLQSTNDYLTVYDPQMIAVPQKIHAW